VLGKREGKSWRYLDEMQSGLSHLAECVARNAEDAVQTFK
jgi:hypothetical protein